MQKRGGRKGLELRNRSRKNPKAPLMEVDGYIDIGISLLERRRLKYGRC
jgi:hypothetical protein